jgi:hypothetical protein
MIDYFLKTLKLMKQPKHEASRLNLYIFFESKVNVFWLNFEEKKT